LVESQVLGVSHLLGGSKEHFSFALRSLIGLLFVFTFIESVGWVVIVVSLRFDFLFSLIRVLLGK
jgi:hypothetical protein